MKKVSISDNLDALLTQPDVVAVMKNGYFTKKLFVDSAIRQLLRKNGIDSDEEVIAHGERLVASKARHLDQQKLAHQTRRAKDRQRKAQAKLNETTE